VTLGNCQRRLVGIISRADVLSIFERADEDIRQEVLATVLLSDFLAHPDTIRVEVTGTGDKGPGARPRPALLSLVQSRHDEGGGGPEGSAT
jgi:hypothetical protein